MNAPDVSVIIPCRNYGRFLNTAVDSVLMQTLKTVEILLFNDGSSDETDAVARQYVQESRVRYIHQARRGLPGTRNEGLRRARGRYIQLLDADDLLDSDKLNHQARLLDADSGATATYCPYRAIDEGGRQIDDPLPWRPISATSPVQDLLLQWEKDLHVPPVCFLFRRDQLAGLTFDETLPTHEEWDFYLHLLLMGGRFLPTAEPLACYRRHAGSLSTDVRRMDVGRRLVLQKIARRGGPAGRWAEQRLIQTAADRDLGTHRS